MLPIFLYIFAFVEKNPDYDQDVKPLMVRSCVSCHNGESKRGGLRLDSVQAMLKGGNSGPSVVAGKASQSLLVHAVTGREDVEQMPPKGQKLTPAEVNILKAWIDAGAKAPESEKNLALDTGKSKHWSFQPVQNPAVPSVRDAKWCRNPIDSFVLSRLESQGMKPSSLADKNTLLRRVCLDLTGLPPTREQIRDFLSDDSPEAYEKAVNSLLNSPHYGERWGRIWLDQARYADSNGYSIDGPRQIWKYRDWVISAINSDVSFDRFSTLQLAGDLVANATLEDRIATGFHRNTPINQEGGIDKEQFRVESVVDRVNTTGTVWLGLTVGCCQCHDHKFDPMSQREYYQLFAFFNTADEPVLEVAELPLIKKRDQQRAELKNLETLQKKVDPLTNAKIASWENRLQAKNRAAISKDVLQILDLAPNGRSPAQERVVEGFFRNADALSHVGALLTHFGNWNVFADAALWDARFTLNQKILNIRAAMPDIASTLVVKEMAKPRDTFIHLAGEFTRKGARVQADTPAVLHPMQRKDNSNRIDLSKWLFDKNNPLTGRVTVNRAWQTFFGLGLVETENDFGTQGTLPSHPDLLDWLAQEYMSQGWGNKDLHRLIVTSATYMQSSNARPEYEKVDARNRLLYKQNRVRMEAELVRDAGLGVSGLLAREIGGPSVFPPQPEGVYSFTQVPKNWKANTGDRRYRRGMYTHFWRSAPHPSLVVFDAPDAVSTCTRRNRSNTPLQALTLLNDEAQVEFAMALANRMATTSASDSEILQQAFLDALGRLPSPHEQQVLFELKAKNSADTSKAGGWLAVARVILNLDEFITRE